MNLKLASRVVYVLYIISLMFVFTTLHAGHLTKSVAISAFIVLTCTYLVLRMKIIRNKVRAGENRQMSGIQKVANNIIISSAFGVMLALMLIVWHVRQIGQPLLNVSLVVCIVGFIGLMATPQKPNAFLSPIQARVYSGVLCLCIVCCLTGLLLGVNHYPGWKQFVFGGMAALVVILILFLIYAKYKKGKLEQ